VRDRGSTGRRPRAAPAILGVAAVLLAGQAGTAQDAPNLAVSTPPAAEITVQSALEEGVEFLVSHQNEDGSFGTYTSGRTWEIMADVPGSLHAFKAATTALCWMGLRDLEDRDRTPESEEAARRALAWLVGNVRVKRPDGVEMYNVWSHGYGLRALAQALRTEAPGADEQGIRAAAASLIEALAIYQVPDGGWGYYDFNAQTYRPSGTSMSFTTATILIALHEAREAGLEVPEAMVEHAVKSVQICRKADGSYIYGWYLRYRPLMDVNQPKGSSMRSPGCNLALRLFGADISDDDLRTGLELIVGHSRFAVAGVRRPIPHESWYQVSGYFYLYGHQYAALCLEHLSADDQRRFWPPLAAAILKTRQPDGSFWDYPLYGFHKFYGTGYALMALSRCPPEIASSISAPPPAPR
jgi:hypothetical protein